MPERRLNESRHTAVDRVDVGLDRRPLTGHVHAVVAEPLGGGLGERERIGLAQRRVVAAALDSGGERQLVQQLGDLAGRRLDHLDVAVRRRRELGRARASVVVKPCTVASGVRTSWHASETSRAKDVSFCTRALT